MIKIDSRKVKEGDTFIALRGVNGDGHNYIEDAIKNGAIKIIAEEGSYSKETIIVKDTRLYLINYIEENIKPLVSDLKIIGITGTNGKTTSCYLLYQALNKLNIKCGYIGTIGFYIDEKIKDLNNTTPELLDIYEMLIECKNQGCKFVVMEVSSHALALKRVEGIEFDYAVFTNLTRDHLDYHKSMDNYALAKQKLFYKIKDDGFAIVNNDDEYKEYFLIPHNKNITYGISDSDYKIDYFNSTIDNTIFKINDEEYHINLIGKHNVYNSLITIIILKTLNIDNKKIIDVLKNLEAPKGRMDKLKKETNTIIVDYAHTPDAVEKVLDTVKELEHNKIITVVGCGGNRDRTKRSLMGKVAATLSDYVIFTSDNPRNEDPMGILNDIVKELDTSNYEIEENRELAIKKGIQQLTKNDILMVLGKGHENYQIIKNKKIHFDDKEIILENL